MIILQGRDGDKPVRPRRECQRGEMRSIRDAQASPHLAACGFGESAARHFVRPGRQFSRLDDAWELRHFCALGMFIGTRTSGKAAPVIANLVYLAMIYLSGILLPMPKSMAVIAPHLRR